MLRVRDQLVNTRLIFGYNTNVTATALAVLDEYPTAVVGIQGENLRVNSHVIRVGDTPAKDILRKLRPLLEE